MSGACQISASVRRALGTPKAEAAIPRQRHARHADDWIGARTRHASLGKRGSRRDDQRLVTARNQMVRDADD
jgi:hypothetical protein